MWRPPDASGGGSILWESQPEMGKRRIWKKTTRIFLKAILERKADDQSYFYFKLII
jgi:hypothetical protein